MSIAVLQGHEYPINCIAMATDFIFTGDSNGSIFVWSKRVKGLFFLHAYLTFEETNCCWKIPT